MIEIGDRLDYHGQAFHCIEFMSSNTSSSDDLAVLESNCASCGCRIDFIVRRTAKRIIPSRRCYRCRPGEPRGRRRRAKIIPFPRRVQR